MSLRATPTALPEVWVVEHPHHADARGAFEELWAHAPYAALGVAGPIVQINHSRSLRGVVRGLHHQVAPHAQGKLISVVRGAVYDVAVDVRPGSPRFGAFAAVTLAEGDGLQLWIPAGFAHGFCALTDIADVVYGVTTPRVVEAERTIAWDDPTIAIPWPVSAPLLSPRDAAAPRLPVAP